MANKINDILKDLTPEQLEELKKSIGSEGHCSRKLYRVTWTDFEDRDFIPGDGRLSLKNLHPDNPDPRSPQLSTAEPVVDYFCEHEIAWLSKWPGIEYSSFWRFTIEELGEEG